jgi:hypothetical protein
VLASGQLAPTSIAVDVQSVYWTNAGSSTAAPAFANGSVMALALGATNAKALASSEPAPDHVRVANGVLYWSSVVSSRVNRMANGGGAITQLNAGETDGGSVMGLALDADAGILTWTENGTSLVRSMTLDGGALSTLALADTLAETFADAGADADAEAGAPDASFVPAGIALDPASIYFSVLAPTPSIVRIDRTCVGSCALEIVTPTGEVYPIAGDATGAYFSDSVAHLVSAVAGGPSAVAIRAALASDAGLMTDIAMDADWVYWTEYGPESSSAPSPRTSSGVVVRARRDLSGRTVLASGQNHPRAITVDDGAIYWTNAGTRTGDSPTCGDPGCFDQSDGQIMRLAKPLDAP